MSLQEYEELGREGDRFGCIGSQVVVGQLLQRICKQQYQHLSPQTIHGEHTH